MRDRIIRSAGAQIGKFGLRRFTIDDIASDLGISKKTVYKYFESKRQIIAELFDRHIENEKNCTLEALKTDGGWLDKLRAVIHCYGQEKLSPGLLEELQLYFPREWEKTQAIRTFKREKVIEVLMQGVEAGEIKKDVHLGILGLILDNTINALFDYKILNRLDLTVNQMMDGVRSIILYGILKQNPNSGECKNEI
ncbi:transcriptional regulator [Desulfocucumis palustris]|uniref:Transcriptional regulator n=1 Tax=Desulfocucumis palustris TaxID=1898651 RepID=A0A2L2XMS0_9FIRM|nr:TetR/AcrR family transcriptional regulator [Desulfocucumis palustris]GBF35251.1 transcriptional regulator [Desulfocucumis palustris]